MVRHGKKEKWNGNSEGTKKAQREARFRAKLRLDFFFHERQKWQKHHYKALTLLHTDEQAEAGTPREITHNKLGRMG